MSLQCKEIEKAFEKTFKQIVELHSSKKKTPTVTHPEAAKFKIAVLAKNMLFTNNFSSKGAIDIIQMLSCSCHQDASKTTNEDLERSGHHFVASQY